MNGALAFSFIIGHICTISLRSRFPDLYNVAKYGDKKIADLGERSEGKLGVAVGVGSITG